MTSQPLEIRLADTSDAADIAAISRDYIERGVPWGWRYERVAKAIRDPETNVIVAGPKGAIIAFGIMSYAELEAHLLLFAVRRSNQRRGVGTTLLAWLEKVALESGTQRILVECMKNNLPARGFYEANGYTPYSIEEDMYNNAIDGVRLRKWLRAGEPA